jgi:hypothetical protein
VREVYNVKTKYIHFGLLAVAAAVVLWYLLRNSSATAAPATTAAPGASPVPVAPAVINLGAVNIGNQPPLINYGAEVGDGPNSACDCGAAGQPVSFPMVASTVYQSSVDNFNSFVSKNGFAAPASTVPSSAVAAPAPKPVAVHFSEAA